MIRAIRERWRQGYRTMPYPEQPPVLPDRVLGRPHLDPSRCPADCHACGEVCPTAAVTRNGGLALDLGRCLFCAACSRACPTGAIVWSGDWRMATRTRKATVVRGREIELAEALDTRLRRLLGRSFKIRQVSAGGCNACEADVNVLSTIGWDLGRFGIQLVASPRHADALLVTGPVPRNMQLALQKTYDATPAPKLVIAVGACAIAGGPFAGHEEITGGAAATLPVDLFIPGCPPHPATILDGLLRLLDRLPAATR
ncbi:MAG: 4Fe-4S binding protein [Thermoanaerobaculaceae bacterium]|nr:4Fe-4S binding protein [Thermoanaerobaculaceae bacterium]MDI9473250.1 4Fe-4S binding protein [Bacillota bacterium]MDI9620493.1 4Fe-4S binding protein [Acidobacteriota bacterium]NLH12713.1 4Fe-4S binding protein [Holophagae bacterium]HPW56261.1 4Fe-4S binding protein [Thermoanaerobaculaceae bacterium]